MDALKSISRTIWLLSIISLFTDMASEMLYPIMPIYLKTIGFSIVMIGFLEGMAEAISGLSKGYFGRMSDIYNRRAPFIQIGYTLSALSKPMMAIFTFPLWIFTARTMDRLGKGIRTGARDAMLSDEANENTKGKIFGFHRAMDTLGAVLGPLLALLFLYFYPQQYKTLFLISFLPGIMAVSLTFFLKDKHPSISKKDLKNSFFSYLNYWKESPLLYRKVVIGLLVFALFNSSDVFLLLKIKQEGFNDTQVIGIYIFYNLIFALCSFPMGILADKIGLKKTYLFGLCIFVVVYTGMSVNSNINGFIVLFFLYGVYAAATEGISKAWISNITDKKDTATAIGTYTGFQSIAAMLASFTAGLIWHYAGPTTAFIMTSAVTVSVLIYFVFFISIRKDKE